MANRPPKRSDAPRLFEDLDPEGPTEDATDESGGLERLVTRVSVRPKGWAMKWRPDESRTLVEGEVDRHPARSSAAEATAPAEPSTPESVSESIGETEAPFETPAVAPVLPDADDESAASPQPVLTSRTWDATAASATRHPQTPGTPPPAAKTSASSRSHPTPTIVRRPRPWVAAGWPIAGLLAALWSGSMLMSGADDTPMATSMSPVLGRPTEAEVFEADLLRSELASMRDERSRLMGEIDAAYILLEDHRRLTRELQDSMATNRGASIEVDALAADLRRWQRRHEVALARLHEMEQELVLADDREAELVAEIEGLRVSLDAPGGTD